MHISFCPSPELYPSYHHEDAVVIVVDIFRATTSIITAFQNGVNGIFPVADIDEAEKLGQTKHYLVAAERDTIRCPFAQFGNDPYEFTPERVAGKEIVMTTTNGTRAIQIARDLGIKNIWIGSFRNLGAILTLLKRSNYSEVIILASGWKGQLALEDSLFAGAFVYRAELSGIGKSKGDSTLILRDLWKQFCKDNEIDALAYVRSAEHYQRLICAGFDSSISYCMQLDRTTTLVELESETGWLRLRKE